MKLRQPVYTDGEEPLTKEEVDSALRDAGYDPEKVGKKMDTVAQQALRIAQLEDVLKLHKHTDKYLTYAARTGKAFCIAECRDAQREALGGE